MLTAQPLVDVVLTVLSGDTLEAMVSPLLLTFTSANWDSAQAVTVTGIDDDSIDGPEACDGSNLAGQTCQSQGFDDGTLTCGIGCISFDTSGCSMAEACNNDLIEGSEVCDGIDLNDETCVSQGFVAGVLGCLSDCSALDTAGCHDCGNDTIDTGEGCDGTDLAGEGCFDQGFTAGPLAGLGDCLSLIHI